MRDIGLDVYHQFSEYLTQILEEKRKLSFLRRRGKPEAISLKDVLSDIDAKVQEAFERELQEVVGSKPEEALAESLVGFQREARLEFLKSLLKHWPEFSQQIFELAPELAPPPAVSKEKLSKLRELQKGVDKAVEDMEKALQAITQALDQVAGAEKEESALLRGTQEENKGRFKDLPLELVWQIKTRLTQWQGRQSGMVEKEKPLQQNRRRW